MNKTNNQPSINLKLSESLKEKVKDKASLKQQTVSKYIRELLSNYIDGTLCKGEIKRNEKKEFINSTEFLQLVVWMYSKKGSKAFKETSEELEQHIRTLKAVEQYLPKNLVLEFDKVLLDLIRVTNESSEYSKDYKFSNSLTSSRAFNFGLLEKYVSDYGKQLKFPSLNMFESAKSK